MIEGVDYSRTAYSGSPSVGVLRANGKKFVGRYAVNDKSPGGRGITADEYRRMTEGGIDVMLFWEGTESWMLGGFEAGVQAAKNANYNIAIAGMPAKTPIYFAHDIDPQPIHYEAIRFCVEGAASVVGWDRMGVYGGWAIIDHLAPIYDKMKFYCQTLAWMYGRGWHPKAQLQQYAFNQYFDGTNCDLIRSVSDEYGQASSAGKPTPKPEPDFPEPWTPDGWEEWVKDPNATVKRANGYRFRPVRMKFQVKQPTIPRVQPKMQSAYAGKKLDVNLKLHSAFVVDKPGTPGYFVQTESGIYITGTKLSPKVTIETS